MPQLIEMSDRRRELILRLVDGDPDSLVLAYLLTQYTRCDTIIAWLIRQNITGKKFSDWVKYEWEKSVLTMVKHILKKVDSDVTTRPILIGPDFK